MAHELVSVVVPVFNVAPWLDDALASLHTQTWRRLEVIVVDDGSTDGSGEMCDAWAARDRRFRVIHQPNGGLSRARNVGLDAARGDVISFLDPDDVWLPTYVERMVQDMEESGANVVACRYAALRGGGASRVPDKGVLGHHLAAGPYAKEEALRALADGALNTAVWNKVYSRDVWGDLRFPEGRVYEDVAVTYEVVNRCDVLFASEDVLCMRRFRSGSITATRTVANYLDYALACSEIVSFLELRSGLFSATQVIRWRARCIRLLILAWELAVSDGGEEWLGLACDLRVLALDAGATAVLEPCDVGTRTLWRMLRDCPRLLAIAYPAYRAVRDRSANLM